MLEVNFSRMQKILEARKAARLMLWDAMLKNSDPIKRRLLARVYNRLAER